MHETPRSPDDTRADATAAGLPAWNLSDLYPGRDAPEVRADLDAAATEAERFAEAYRGRVAELDPATFAKAIGEYEALVERLHRVASYAQLLYAANVSDAETGRFYQTVSERVTDISSDTLFFTLEINRIDDADLETLLADDAVAHYGPWLREVRLFRDHELSDEMEQLLHQKSVTGRSAWVRLFEETLAGFRFAVEGEEGEKTLSDVLDMLSSRDGDRRRTAAKALGGKLGDNVRLFGLVTNTLAKDKEIEDRWRRYAHPMASRNLANQVEDEVVEALASAVKDAYPRLSHRYYALKAGWFGVDKLDYWDRNAPLPDAEERRFSWDDARRTVLEAYGDFAPPMAEIADTFFERNWIDAAPRPGKDSGAFSHPTVPSVHPYILMNFHGKARDVMTLAHELGHGVHQVLSGPKGTLMADTPLTLAETASVFGEMLTFRSLLERETDPAKRRVPIAGKVEDMLNTVVRQIAFHEFERRVHAERPEGEIAVERINEIWLDVQRESLGPAFRFDDEYRYFWAYIPHFVHTPFYVYAYAFGDCLVNSLYDVFRQGHPGFQEKYLEMLKAGGTLRHRELLAPFGLDASDPGFWRRGLDVVAGLIDELEADA